MENPSSLCFAAPPSKQAASESVRGENIRERVHDVTLEALKTRRFDRESIREVVRAVTEGMTRGAEGSRLGVRHALAEGLRGIDQALTKSVDAGREAIRQMAATGRGISDNEVKQALAGLRKAGPSQAKIIEDAIGDKSLTFVLSMFSHSSFIPLSGERSERGVL